MESFQLWRKDWDIKSTTFWRNIELTLHNWPLSFLTSNRKGVDKARLDAIRPIRIDSHGNPCSLNDKAKGRKNKEKLQKLLQNYRSNEIWKIEWYLRWRKRTFGVPRTQSRIWSQAALAADNALDSFRALIMAAPRCCTVVMNSVFNLPRTEKQWRFVCEANW